MSAADLYNNSSGQHDTGAFFTHDTPAHFGFDTNIDLASPAQSGNMPQAFSVSQALGLAKNTLESIGSIWVEGEVSECSPFTSYSAVYFDLKDDQGSNVSCIIWKSVYENSGVQLERGLKVRIFGFFSAYPQKGRLQFHATEIIPQGEGALRQQVAKLAALLNSQGLFGRTPDFSLSRMPEKIGLVTSPSGAAVQDVRRTLENRYPLAQIYFAGATVEGANAVSSIRQALNCVSQADVEVILLVRGGGSYEDLMPFNDEGLCRQIHASRIPIVTGIGHEPDQTIADLVTYSGFNRATPTAAAQFVTPLSAYDINEGLAKSKNRIDSMCMQRFSNLKREWDSLASRKVLASPYNMLSSSRQNLDHLNSRLEGALPDRLHNQSVCLVGLKDRLHAHASHAISGNFHIVENTGHRLNSAIRRSSQVCTSSFENAQLRFKLCANNFGKAEKSLIANSASRLHDLSPLTVLARGFSLAKNAEGKLIKSARNVAEGDAMSIQLTDGVIDAKVLRINDNN